MISLVVSCSERKRAVAPAELRLRTVADGAPDERAARWWRRLEQADSPRYPAAELYAGEHWTQALAALAALEAGRQVARLWVASAGYGLVSSSARLSAYSATFTAGSPDFVGGGTGSTGKRREQAQAWWAALAAMPGPEPGEARALHAIGSADPQGAIIVVASPAYVCALRRDIVAARGALEVPESFVLISNHALLADDELAPSLIPVDERSQTLVGGTLMGLNARVAHRLLDEGRTGPLTAPRLRERYDSMVSDAAKPPKHNRERMDDEEVLSFLRTQLQQDPNAGWTLLLRTLRGMGRACEQGRLRGLHQQVRGEVTAAT